MRVEIIQKHPVGTVCGSMRYQDLIMQCAHDFTEMGWIILIPMVVAIPPGQTQKTALKEMLDEMHLRKIDMSDAIIIVGEHRGESVTREIEYAREIGKEVIEWVPVTKESTE
jgi:hypothetical protein